MLYKLVIYVLFTLTSASALNILVVFPFPSRSHDNYGKGFVRALLKAGHQVTYVTPYPWPDTPNLTIVDLSSFQGKFDARINVTQVMTSKKAMMSFLYQGKFGVEVSNMVLNHPNVQKLLMSSKRFNLIIAERFLADIYPGLKFLYNAPLINFIPHEVLPWNLAVFHDHPNPAYTSQPRGELQPPYDFFERIQSLQVYVWERLLQIFIIQPKEEKVYNNIFKPIAEAKNIALPTYKEALRSVDFALSASHFTLSEPKVLPENIIQIGGFHIEEDNELPQDLKKFLDSATDGVIYFSMGSNLKSKDMSKELKQSLIDMFSKMKQRVVWKFEEDFPSNIDNIFAQSWLPQSAILAHPNLKVFVTHGGLLSVTEAVHYGVPLIGIPMFADQFINTKRVERNGYGIEVKISLDLAKDLEVALRKVLSDDSYAKAAKKISSLYHDRPLKPADELVYWVEYIHRHGGGAHLDSYGRHLPLYQKLYLDLFLPIAMISLVVFFIVGRKCCKQSEKVVTGGKKRN